MSDKVRKTIKAIIVLVLTLISIWFGVEINSRSNDPLALTQEITYVA